MRLTNEMRNDFAERVVSKIPVKSEWNREKVIAEIERRLFDSLPDDVKGFSKKYPNLINRTSQRIQWLDYEQVTGDWLWGRVNCVITCDLANIDVDDLKYHWKAFKKEYSERKELERRIREQAYGCNTLAQLQTMFPDLIGLMPKEEKVIKHPLVPAKSLVDELVKVGLEIPQ